MDATKSPLAGRKMPRRHYKAEFEKMGAYADELVADLQDTKKDRMDAEDEMLRQTERADRWAIAAVIEGLVLVIVAIILWAR